MLRSCFAVCLFQSTHPSGVRHPRRSHRKDPRTISIHAPQWGATWPPSWQSRKARYFNPRTPVGCDKRPRKPKTFDAISIHAPQWGATTLSFISDLDAEIFQSTHPSGVRLAEGATIDWKYVFQSTHPSGVRLRGFLGLLLVADISIHAPQWGATFVPLSIRCITAHFNPRTPVGCDVQVMLRMDLVIGISIHAPQWGATGHGCPNRRDIRDFNPRTPVGCDFCCVAWWVF